MADKGLPRVITILVAHRVAARVTKEGMAVRMGVRPYTITAMERTGSNPTLATLEKYAGELGLTLTAERKGIPMPVPVALPLPRREDTGAARRTFSPWEMIEYGRLCAEAQTALISEKLGLGDPDTKGYV